MQLLAKENLLIVVAVICLVIYYYRKQLNQSKSANLFIDALPKIGGIAFGLNTLFSVTK